MTRQEAVDIISFLIKSTNKWDITRILDALMDFPDLAENVPDEWFLFVAVNWNKLLKEYNEKHPLEFDRFLILAELEGVQPESESPLDYIMGIQPISGEIDEVFTLKHRYTNDDEPVQ